MKPLDAPLLDRIAREFGTPCYVYDAARIRGQIDRLRAFDVIRYAQKASSNTHLLRLMRAEGVVVDAVSLGEIERAVRAGYTAQGDPPGIVYAADQLDAATLERIVELDVPVNVGSEDMLSDLGRRKRGHTVWLRINPGFGHGHSRKTNTGGESSKHGIWHENLPEALARISEYDLDLRGLHMHIGSGSDFEHLKQVCEAMVELVDRVVSAGGRDVAVLSAGGGLPVPYRPGGQDYDTEAHFRIWHETRLRAQKRIGHEVSLEIEPGRFLVAEAGVLVSEVRAVKKMGRNRFFIIDAGFDDLARPAMYGSFHAISIVRRGGYPADGPTAPTAVGGPLCESGDVFTQEDGGIVAPVDLPAAEQGDWVVLHDAGAYGASMASNYNSRTLAPEVLVEDGEPRLIRRRQEIEDLLALEEV